MAAKIIVSIALTLNAVLWSHSRYYGPPTQPPQWNHQLGIPAHKLVTRHWEEWNGLGLNTTLNDSGGESLCAPLSVPVDQQCKHVQDDCPHDDTFLSIDYLESYFCASAPQRPWKFTGLILWLIFLFSFIGITASDFFCPNLATIAHVFGLSENIAGVTFLAFGNGSPDLFSTYSAMRTNSGSLAIGELLGAASFIVSVVVGSMCIIKPFAVRRSQFLRDVGFFTTAVTMLLAILIDGKVWALEALGLIGLYLIYVATVILGTWWETRQLRRQKREALIRDEYAEEDRFSSVAPTVYTDYTGEGPYRDDPYPIAVHLLPASPRVRSHSNPVHPSHDYQRLRPTVDTQQISQSQLLPSRPRTPSPSSGAPGRRRLSRPRSTGPLRPQSPNLPSFSLLGALEFREVINSLKREATSESLDVFETPVTPFAAAHYHRHSVRSHHSERGRTPLTRGFYDEEQDPWDAALGVPLGDRANGHAQEDSSHTDQLPLPGSIVHSHKKSPIPSISIHSPDSPSPSGPPSPEQHVPVSQSAPADLYALSSGTPSSQTAVPSIPHTVPEPQGRAKKLRCVLYAISHTLFPTLRHITAPNKSWMGRIAAIVAAPAVLMLTLTLPVVITTDEEGSDATEPKAYVPEGQLVDVDTEASGMSSGNDSPITELSLSNPITSRRRSEDEERDEERLDSDIESEIMSIQEDIEEGFHGGPGLHYNRYLTAVQCIIGPVFAAGVLFSNAPHGFIVILGTLGFGALLALLTLTFTSDGKNLYGRIIRCLMGFAVAVTWIMAIADEVVRVLQTFGYIFGLSDAIVGLTVFAIGNSLADFVANLSVATFAPIMGFSACFGGPMLNILLGVGISGSLVLRSTGRAYYPIEFSTTLLVSGIGLLFLLVSTLIFVPLNGFWLSRRWGFFLITSYIVIMTVNIVVEVKRER